MITATISNFTGQYARLNSPQSDIDISLIGLARCVMSVGQAGRHEVLQSGFWRLSYLLCMTFAHVREENGYLRLSDLFMHRLDQSEKISVSYQLGMGLSKACAELLLDIPWLIHTRHFGNITLSRSGRRLPPKIQLHPSPRPAREPDLIGIDKSGRPHVFEAKGYSSGPNPAELQHAIDQVSQVVSINGVPPATRVVTFFDMSGHRIDGEIIDPDETPDAGIRYERSIGEFLNDYYSSYLNDDAWYGAQRQERFGRTFMLREVGMPNYFFGLDYEVYQAMRDHEIPENAFRFYADNYREINNSNEKNVTSVGMDGMILLTR